MTSAPKFTTDEMIDSLTGFDEIAIEKQFGSPWQTLAKAEPTMFLRSLVFVSKRREGLNDIEAKQAVMELTLREAQECYGEDTEIDAEEPVTESGKDD